MPNTTSQTVQQIRAAHAAIAEPCGSTSENFRTSEIDGERAATPIDPNLTPQQCLAIGHLSAGRSFSKTAELVRVSPRTLYEWRKNPAFQARLNQTCAEAIEAVAMRSREVLLRGSEKLQGILDSANFTQTLRLVSNKRIWEMAHVMPRFDESDPAREAAGNAVK